MAEREPADVSWSPGDTGRAMVALATPSSGCSSLANQLHLTQEMYCLIGAKSDGIVSL